MNSWNVTVLMLAGTALVSAWGSSISSGPATPMERAFEDVRSQHRDASLHNVLSRGTRSANGGVPCVTVPFLTELKERFIRWLDHDNDGQSTFDEVKNYIRRFKPDVTDQTVAAFISRRDSNGNGAIDFVPEYVHDMAAPDYTLEGANEWFKLQDTNDDSFVTEAELVKVAEAVGMSPEEALDTVQGYYMSADANKDGKLSLDEFKTLYSP
ncbi:unnamed protein product [Lymnaea stagnalis]|uniref:EF-hand domain-containing protein n=2 Tax=Lymnaea stagnalis TaxID=6523 RepID=A0AAV2H967_LYMST